MNIQPAFQYGPTNSGRTFAAYNILKSDQGRTIASDTDQDLVAAFL